MSGKSGKLNEFPNRTVNDRVLSKKLAAVGWGLLLVWIGIVRLADLGTGGGLLGVGVIILAIQGARSFFTLPTEGFWMVAGLILVASGVWDLFQASLPVFPFLVIAAGGALIFSGLRGGRRKEKKLE